VKYLDALLKAGIIVLLYLILVQMGVIGWQLKDSFSDIHSVKHELGTISNRLDSNMVSLIVERK